MLTIFNGRKLSLDGVEDLIYAQVAVGLRDHIYLFNNGKNLNPFGVFMCLALHANKDGWAWPGRKLIMKETGISTEKAITSAATHLRNMWIDGHRVCEVYRPRKDDGTLGPLVFRLFPSNRALAPPVAWTTGGMRLVAWDGQATRPLDDEPLVGEPLVVDHLDKKENHYKEEAWVCELDLDDEVYLNDGAEPLEKLTAQCTRCGATVTQSTNVCPDCGAHVVWHRSKIWKREYGNPVHYLREIEGIDLKAATPLEIKVTRTLNRKPQFGNQSQMERFRKLPGYPDEYIMKMAVWAKNKRAGWRGFLSAVKNPDNYTSHLEECKLKPPKPEEDPGYEPGGWEALV